MKLNVQLDEEEERRVNLLKKKYGIKQATELVRFLIAKEAENVAK